MAVYSDLGLPIKIFVKEKNVVNDVIKPRKERYLPVNPRTGESPKEFYEKIISEIPTVKPESPVNQPKSTIRKHADSKAHISQTKCKSGDLHKLAQNNEFETLERVLRDNKDISIDEVDGFGWTPLMCAVTSRAREAVEILIKNKAKTNICDKIGNSALSLAKRKNFDIIEIIEKCDSKKATPRKKNHKSVEPIFCKLCKREFHMDVKTHQSSILHLFNSRPENPKTFYGIPDSNRGFQLLLKNGWNREKGLGPNECGMKFPIKVKKKNDRIGIGGKPVKTTSETEGRTTTSRHDMKKKIRLNQDRREKCFERNYRLQFL